MRASFPTARADRDAENAIAIGRISRAVLGRDTDGNVYLASRGTFVLLARDILEGLKCSTPSTLVLLVEPLNALLKKRRDTIQSATELAPALAESDAEFANLGYPDLLQTLIALARAHERKLLIAGGDGAGGLLIIPPKPLIAPPPTVNPEEPNEIETVKKVTQFSEVVTPAGAAFRIPAVAVDTGVRPGSRARLLRTRRGHVGWRTVRALRQIPGDEGGHA